MRSRLKEIMTKREIQEGRRISQKEIVDATQLNPNTISRWMSPKPFKRFEAEPITKLCTYLGVEIGELLYIDTLSPGEREET